MVFIKFNILINIKGVIYMKEVKEPFNTKYPTWIIAFCPDINSFFVTNQRHFFWESEEEFNSENDGINYFEQNISYFIDIANKTIHTNKVWLENTSKWYKLNSKSDDHYRTNEEVKEQFRKVRGYLTELLPIGNYYDVEKESEK